MSHGPFVARVGGGSYDNFGCDRKVGHGIVASLVQAPGNQFHALFSTLTPLLAIDRDPGAPPPVLLLDDHNGAPRLFATNATTLETRERRQYAAAFDVALLSDLAGERVCFDRLTVGVDERDGLHGFAYASNGLVASRGRTRERPLPLVFPISNAKRVVPPLGVRLRREAVDRREMETSREDRLA